MIKNISYITRGKLRKSILELLDKPKTPTQLSKKLNTHRSSVSRALLDLEEKRFVKCLNPDEKLARFYQITNQGKEVLKKVEELRT